ncbi:MAG: hypothetical protein IJ560_01890 [Alphaproteobacteria bacterium]|nr:hypothetical protein [Alphaproteobacteria bacterium]
MYKLLVLLFLVMSAPVYGASIVATVGGTPITDTDITARTKLMSRQGNISANNRNVALQNIIDDSVKLNYATNFNAIPTDADVDKELKRMNMTDLSASERDMARRAIRAEIAWQIVVARTVLPMVDVSDDDIAREKQSLAQERGLPLEMTIVRLVNVPDEVASKLTRPKSCDAAVEMAEKLGGAPQRFTAMQYELAPDVRSRVAGMGTLVWSKPDDGTIYLVCSSKKTAEYGKLDDIIKQNATYKQAMFMADQQLKQLRRRAVVVINDNRYKL